MAHTTTNNHVNSSGSAVQSGDPWPRSTMGKIVEFMMITREIRLGSLIVITINLNY